MSSVNQKGVKRDIGNEGIAVGIPTVTKVPRTVIPREGDEGLRGQIELFGLAEGSFEALSKLGFDSNYNDRLANEVAKRYHALDGKGGFIEMEEPKLVKVIDIEGIEDEQNRLVVTKQKHDLEGMIEMLHKGEMGDMTEEEVISGFTTQIELLRDMMDYAGVDAKVTRGELSKYGIPLKESIEEQMDGFRYQHMLANVDFENAMRNTRGEGKLGIDGKPLYDSIEEG